MDAPPRRTPPRKDGHLRRTPPRIDAPLRRTPPRVDDHLRRTPPAHLRRTPPRIDVNQRRTPPGIDDHLRQTPPRIDGPLRRTPPVHLRRTPPRNDVISRRTPPRIDLRRRTPPRIEAHSRRTPPRIDDHLRRTPPRMDGPLRRTPPRIDGPSRRITPRNDDHFRRTPPRVEVNSRRSPPRNGPLRRKPDEIDVHFRRKLTKINGPLLRTPPKNDVPIHRTFKINGPLRRSATRTTGQLVRAPSRIVFNTTRNLSPSKTFANRMKLAKYATMTGRVVKPNPMRMRPKAVAESFKAMKSYVPAEDKDKMDYFQDAAPERPLAGPSTPSVAPSADGKYQLDAVTSRELEDELRQMMDSVMMDMPEPESDVEKAVADRFRSSTCEHIKQALGLNVTKRLLNIHNPLFVKLQFSRAPSAGALRRLAAWLGVPGGALRPLRTRTVLVARLDSAQQMDRACRTRVLVCGDVKVKITPCYKYLDCPEKINSIYNEKTNKIDNEEKSSSADKNNMVQVSDIDDKMTEIEEQNAKKNYFPAPKTLTVRKNAPAVSSHSNESSINNKTTKAKVAEKLLKSESKVTHNVQEVKNTGPQNVQANVTKNIQVPKNTIAPNVQAQAQAQNVQVAKTQNVPATVQNVQEAKNTGTQNTQAKVTKNIQLTNNNTAPNVQSQAQAQNVQVTKNKVTEKAPDEVAQNVQVAKKTVTQDVPVTVDTTSQNIKVVKVAQATPTKLTQNSKESKDTMAQNVLAAKDKVTKKVQVPEDTAVPNVKPVIKNVVLAKQANLMHNAKESRETVTQNMQVVKLAQNMEVPDDKVATNLRATKSTVAQNVKVAKENVQVTQAQTEKVQEPKLTITQNCKVAEAVSKVNQNVPMTKKGQNVQMSKITQNTQVANDENVKATTDGVAQNVKVVANAARVAKVVQTVKPIQKVVPTKTVPKPQTAKIVQNVKPVQKVVPTKVVTAITGPQKSGQNVKSNQVKGPKRAGATQRKKESDYDELNDKDILALISGGIVLDECGSDDE